LARLNGAPTSLFLYQIDLSTPAAEPCRRL